MKEIADWLANGACDYDIVALQEVWDIRDYEMIRRAVAKTLSHSYYFQGGLVGTGICLFAKGPIVFTMLHRYSLNGYPHHIHRGDWFGGKIVGFARIELRGLKIDVYVTHLHAEYDRESDPYLPHRILQAFEPSQFVKGTLTGDVALVIGDLNIEPEDIGTKLVQWNAELFDAFVTRLD